MRLLNAFQKTQVLLLLYVFEVLPMMMMMMIIIIKSNKNKLYLTLKYIQNLQK